MNHTEQLQAWRKLITEAEEGSVGLHKSIQQSLIKYGREASQFDLPNDYGDIKAFADLIQTMNDLIKSTQDKIEDPLAQSLLARFKNMNLPSYARQLDNLAKAANPEKP